MTLAVVAVAEEALISAAQAGDVEAFGELYRRYVGDVQSFFARRQADETAADDFSQEVFVKAMQALAGYHWTGVPFRAWLFTIARHLLRDHRRRRARRPVEALPTDDVFPDHSVSVDPEWWVLAHEAQLALIDAVSELAPAQRRAIVLTFGCGLTCVEAARVLGKTEFAVKHARYQGLHSLRRRLSADD